MSNEHAAATVHRPGPAPHVLALLFGLLALPGSTVAWDLPLGRLWIGGPLIAAALRCGLRPRPSRGDARAAPPRGGGDGLAGLYLLQMLTWTAVWLAGRPARPGRAEVAASPAHAVDEPAWPRRRSPGP